MPQDRADVRYLGPAGKRALAAVTSPRVILVVGWLLFFVYASPGYLSPDSAWQLAQGRQGVYVDWHPPAMAALWGVLDRIVSGPFLMLVAQSGAFLAGTYWILRAVLVGPRRAALIACAILLFPPVLTTMAVIWKDSQMAGYLLAATACVLAKRRWIRIAGLLLFALGAAMRDNAPAAILPLIVLLFAARDGMRWYVRAAIACAAFVAVVVVALALNKKLTDHRSHTWHGSIAPQDIVGIVAHAEPISDVELNELLAGTHVRVSTDVQRTMRRVYLPANYWHLLFGDDRVFEAFPATEVQRDRIAHAWWKLLTEHPYAYYRHRFKVSMNVLGWKHPTWGPVWDGFNEHGRAYWEGVGIEQHHSAWQAWWIQSLRDIENTWLFQPYVYFLLTLLGLLLIPWLARDRLVFALLMSGLGCEASLFLAAPSPDYRYSHWMVCTTVIAFVIVFTRRYRAGRLSRPAA